MKQPAVHSAVMVGEDIDTYTFIKKEDRWFLTLPSYVIKGYHKMTEMVEGAQTMLNTIARGKTQVSIKMDREPFDGADRLELIELCEAPRGGAYYLMNTCNGKRINKRMWVCDLALLVFGDLPNGVYFQKCPDPLYQ